MSSLISKLQSWGFFSRRASWLLALLAWPLFFGGIWVCSTLGVPEGSTKMIGFALMACLMSFPLMAAIGTDKPFGNAMVAIVIMGISGGVLAIALRTMASLIAQQAD